jgi:hypothetical protein
VRFLDGRVVNIDHGGYGWTEGHRGHPN